MLKQTCFLMMLGFFFCFSSTEAQIVPIGDGSYTTSFPGKDVAGRNSFPAGQPQLSGAVANRPVPTNDWWSKLVKENHADNLYNYPFAMKTQSNGLVVNYIPWGVQGDAQAIIVGTTGLNEGKATVSAYSDWTVTMDWGAKFHATSGIGMPFLYFGKTDSQVATVTVNAGTASVSGEMITVLNAGNGANYVIYAPTGSTWTVSGKTYTSTLNGKNYWSLAMLPQGQANVAEIANAYKKHAYVFPANTQVSWAFDAAKSVVTTKFEATVDVKEGTDNQLLMGLLPHQWRHLSGNSPTPQGYTYASVRGPLRMLAGNTFTTEYSYHGILPTLPYLSNNSEGFNLSDLYNKVKLLENEQLATWTDSYNEGQVMNRLIQTARIADNMGMDEARDKMIATVKERLEDWLTAESGEVAFIYFYNDDWSAMLGYPAGHGQDSNINDHHFHWGYFIHAAAFMEQFEPGWAAKWGPMIDLLVRDAASPDRNDPLFPFLRNFSPYAGHCWANGFASFPQGNDQESTSESMQFNSSLIHWGSITGDNEVRDLGIYLYVTEQAAVEEYWFDIHEEIFPDNPYSVVSRVWGNSYDNGTFWTSDIEASYGIELYPIHGGSMYLGHPKAYAQKLWAEIESNTGILSNDDNVNLWHDTMWKYLAFTDPQKAIDLYDGYPDRILKFGTSDAQTYYWLHAMNAIGQVDATVTANHPLAVAFKKNNAYTYVAHNYSNAPIEVTFSTGFVLPVPANAMATNRDTDISGELVSSFPAAYPGGSVELTLNASGGTPSKVEFFDNGVRIGEVTAAPFSFQATNLAARIHGFYAKIYDGETFGMSNIATVIVGEQRAYNDSALALPGIIEAGHYDYYEGGSGQGIAYADASSGNEGGFRPDEAADAVEVTGEGATVGWINGGEWLEYTVQVAQSGVHGLSFRYASGNAAGGGPFHLQLNGKRISPNITVPTTTGWNKWASATAAGIELPKGRHILRVSFDNGEFNLGKMTFTRTGDLSYGPPVANAGSNVTVMLPNATAILDGSLSQDPDNQNLTFSWKQIYGPSLVVFSDKQVAKPSVSNLKEGIYKFELQVSDGQYASTDEVLTIVSLTGNANPQISIATPLNNASFKQGQAIKIGAKTSDLDGSVVKVEFFQGETKLGEANGQPFEFNWTNAAVGEYSLKAIATDNGGAKATSEVVRVKVQEVQICTETSNQALQGTFSTGYKATFETVGNTVTVTFELLDTDKAGLVAYLWEESPFSEVQMDFVSGRTFSKQLSNRTAGQTLSIACKFAFAGGLSVTKYLKYVVGNNCGSAGNDVIAPANFTATTGAITTRSIELRLNATDASGTVTYEVGFNGNTLTTSSASGVQKSFIINQLQAGTSYDFSVKAKDFAGNVAANSPIALTAKTLEDTSTPCAGTGIEAQQGSFEAGYRYAFETIGTGVKMTFELLDNKDGLVAFVWRKSPFAETAMTKVSGKTFTVTIPNQTIGATISYACKFAFAGGLAVTKYFDYKVGDDCRVGDTAAPFNFTADTGAITPTSVALKLKAEDNSGKVFFNITYGNQSRKVEGVSGVSKTVLIEGLTGNTAYSFVIAATDSSNNVAANSPLTVQARTATEPPLSVGDDWEALSVYPNPAASELKVEWSKFRSATLYSLLGEQLLHTNQASVPLRGLPAGLYILALESQQGEIVKVKVVKE